MYEVSMDISHDQACDLVKKILIDDLECVSSQELSSEEKKLIEALNRVIAYYSIPGEWKEGVYE